MKKDKTDQEIVAERKARKEKADALIAEATKDLEKLKADLANDEKLARESK